MVKDHSDERAHWANVTSLSSTPATSSPVTPPSPPPPPWWRDAVIYQVYIRSFADSDGDGVGDLAGIRSRLPYLRDLGVDALWVTPFYPSPMADGGYDVADYRNIEPLFGTLADADALVTEAHALGLRVIVDLVPNHTSDQHVWFKQALSSLPGSRERARYIFRDGQGPDGAQPPNDWPSVFGGTAWQRVPDGQWYLHLFAPEQPDLDWQNPDVRAEFEAILRFWLDRGVDGFRIDVAHGLVKDPALPDIGPDEEHILGPPDRPNHPFWDRDGVHDIYRSWRNVLDVYDGDRMAVAEAWVRSPERVARYIRPDELQQSFNFHFLKAPWSAPTLRRIIDTSLKADREVDATTTWVLSNHDIERVVTRYGGGDTGRRRARAAALLMLALPGSAYIYQGEELGLEEVDLPDEALRDPIWERSGRTRRGRDGARVPLPWSGSASPYGFSPDGAAPWLPQPTTWRSLTVEAQLRDPDSTLSLYRQALSARHTIPALRASDMRWLDAPSDDVLAFTRGNDGLVCVINAGTSAVALPGLGKVILASGPLTEAGALPADTAAWYDGLATR
jgi:alpha-glucosidase